MHTENIRQNLLKMRIMRNKIKKGCGQWRLSILGITEEKISLFVVFFLTFLLDKKQLILKLNIQELKMCKFLVVYKL